MEEVLWSEFDFMTHILLLMLAVQILDPCTAANSGAQKDGQQVTVTGTLVFQRHSAHLVSNHAGKKCLVFAAFPGTPDFMVPDNFKRDLHPTTRVVEFSKNYKMYLENPKATFKQVTIRGVLRVKPAFTSTISHGNGFGYRGLFRTAIIVNDIWPTEPP